MNHIDHGVLVAHRYQVEHQLGAGGMGSVYRAIDRLTGRVVALKKVLVSKAALDDDTRKAHHLALATEFKLLASLRHPNVINVLDFGFDADQQPFFTMDFIEKPETLVEFGRGLSIVDQVKLVIQMLHALDYLYRRGVIHHDLKPDNVLVDDGRVRVLDFGIARSGDDAGAMRGTLAYMAPELLREVPASRASDLYAVGVMLFELLAGAHPYRIENVNELINDIILNTPDFSDVMALDDDGKLLPDVRESMTHILMRLLAKDPYDRYQTPQELIVALCEAVEIPVPPESAEIRDSYLQMAEFVGRESEFDQLATAITQLDENHQGGLWIVGGESGVGKSRLLDEVRTWALVQGVPVLRGQAVSNGGLSYQLWREPLRRLALSADLSDLEAGILKEAVPDIHLLLGRSIPDVPDLERESQQRRLAETVSDILRRQPQPLILLLEDLQWTQESLDLLKQIVHVVDESPLLMIATVRDDERPDIVEEFPKARVIHLKRFSSDTIRQLSESMLGESGGSAPVLSLLERETEGNVYFLIEVVRALAEDAGRLQDVGAVTLPEHVFAGGVREVLRQRLGRVNEDSQPLMRLAAVAGRQLDLAVLEETMPDVDIEHWLNVLANAAVIELVDDVWRFTHDKLRDAILNDIDADRLPSLHRRVALATETVYPDDPVRAPILATHWHKAGDTAKETQYVIDALRQTYNVSDYTAALRFGEWGRSLLSDDDARLVHVLKLLGDVQWSLSNFARAADYYQQSLDIALKHELKEAMSAALFGLGQSHWRMGELEQAITYNKEALALAEETGSQVRMADAYNGLGVATFDMGEIEQAGEYYRKSLELSEAAEWTIGIARGNNNLGNVYKYTGKFEQAREHVARAVGLYKQVGDKQNTAFAILNLGAVMELLRDYDAARVNYQEGVAICRQIGSVWGLAAGISNLGALAESQEDYETARMRHLEALDIAEAVGDPYLIASILGNIVFTGLFLEDEAFVMPYLYRMIEEAQTSKIQALVLEGVTGFAWLCMLRDEKEKSAEIAGYLQDHVDASVADFRLKPLLDKLRPALGEDAMKKALEKGKSLDFEKLVTEILAEKEQG